jgi:hypothetical protein
METIGQNYSIIAFIVNHQQGTQADLVTGIYNCERL